MDSLVAFANICDTIHVRLASDLKLAARGPFAEGVILDKNNLVLRAALALKHISNGPAGAELTLTKNLPVAAGIGGGSADAAATIRALIRLWDIHWEDHDFSALALSLGADVPVCLYGRAAFMGGIGDRVKPGPILPPTYLVIVNPGVAVSTPAVFKARIGPYSEPAYGTYQSGSAVELARQLAQPCNDLTAPAISIAPEVGRVLGALDSAEDCLIARMSGSGATCFGMFETNRLASTAASIISEEHP